MMMLPLWLVLVMLMTYHCSCHASISALIIIDVQHCFTTNGTLEVKDGDKIIPVINSLREMYSVDLGVVAISQDWHCSKHVSFASQYTTHNDYVNLTYIKSTGSLCQSSTVVNPDYTVDCSNIPASNLTTLGQKLWPDHCIIGTTDAQIHKQLDTKPTDIIIQKGSHCQIDSYSAFYDNGRMSETALHDELQRRRVQAVYIVGLTTDYCVYYTAKDALTLGYKTHVILDATRGVQQDTIAAAVADMKTLGILVINSTDISSTFPPSSASTQVRQMFFRNTLFILLAILTLSS